MAKMDEFREEREAMKEKPFGERLAYFWEYNKLPVIIGLFGIICAISIIVSIVTKKEALIEGILLNRYWLQMDGANCDKISNAYLEYRGLDPEENELLLNGSLYFVPNDEGGISTASVEAAQAIAAQCIAGALDFMTADVESLHEFDSTQYMYDLRDVLTEEQLERYSDYFIYSKRDETIPIMVDVTGSKTLESEYTVKYEQMGFAIMANAPHIEETQLFLDYLMQDK